MEYHSVSVAISAAAGFDNSASIPLDKPGFFMGASGIGITNPAGDTGHTIGEVQIRDGAASLIAFGSSIANIALRIASVVGDAGTIVFAVVVFIRDHPPFPTP